MVKLTPQAYPNHRNSIKSGDVLAFGGNSWGARVIKAWTHGDYSHVGIAWVVGGRVLVLEAREGRGVVASPLSRRLGCDLYPANASWDSRMQARALLALGEPYNLIDALRAGFGIRPNGAGWQCAEYVSAVLGLGACATPAAIVECIAQC